MEQNINMNEPLLEYRRRYLGRFAEYKRKFNLMTCKELNQSPKWITNGSLSRSATFSYFMSRLKKFTEASIESKNSLCFGKCMVLFIKEIEKEMSN